jgi:predicted ferric reductase
VTGLLFRAAIWFGFYVFLVTFPLVTGAVFHPAAGRSFFVEFGIACGFVGLAVMVFQFALISRVKSVSSAFGQDTLAQFHRQMGYAAIVFVTAHPVALCLGGYPWPMLNPMSKANPAAWRWGALALYGLLLLAGLVAWRKLASFSYEWWRLSHALLSTAVILFAVLHIQMLANYAASKPMQMVWALYLALLIGLAFWYRLLRPLQQWRRPWTVVRNIAEAGDAHTLVLHPEGHAGLRFEPGQFAWLTLGNSPFHFEQHPISISSSAEIAPGGEVAFTIKRLGDWSSRVIPNVKAGARVWVDGPYGVFSPDQEQGPGYVLIGGGIGIAPLLSICRTFADREDLRPAILFYGCRDSRSLIFREELETLTSRMNLKVVYVLQHPPEGWKGEAGFITADVLRRHLPKQFHRFQYFVCGPPPMMDAMEDVLPGIGIPWRLIHTERFDLD